MDFFEFYRKERWPHMFCSGCGLGIMMNTLWKAVDEMKYDMDEMVFVSGIGCTGRVSGYIKADSLHTTHGRPLAFATGIKLANPDLKVVVISGDGDLFGIGGNHIIHAARRNIDITTICVNNANYGLTGGQAAPTTPINMRTSTTPLGNKEQPFGLSELVTAAGADYVARWTVAQPFKLRRSIKKAFESPGFSFVEVISPCPINFGRKNKLGKPVQYLDWIKKHTKSRTYKREIETAVETDGDTFEVGVFAKHHRSDNSNNR